jgi:pSer/pThr/pTyr-binding forkhead associated (FHA) protein/tetratricopeptide (TPR) repeat protein
MAVLKVSKNNSLVKEIQLDPGQVYLGGRREGCQIQLDPEPGISRDHFQISHSNDGWKVEVKSTYGEFYVGGEKIPGFTTQQSQKFSIPPYEFDLEIGPGEVGEGMQNSGGEDRTMVSAMPSIAVLKVIDAAGKVRQKFRLEGAAWVAGRDVSCSLFLDNSKASRKQFEVSREGSQFKIRDLGSANGTTVNNHQISAKEWTLLESGDIIGVIDWSLVFELQDASYDERVQNVNPELKKPLHYEGIYDQPDSDGGTNIAPPPEENPEDWAPPQFEDPNAPQYQEPPPVYHPPQLQQQSYQGMPPPDFQMGGQMGGATDPSMAPPAPPPKKKSLIVPITFAILLLAGGFYIYDEYFSAKPEPAKAAQPAPPPKPKNDFEKLSAEDQLFVAKVRSDTGKMNLNQEYNKTLEEINKVRERIPSYPIDKDAVLAERETTARTGLEQQNALRAEEEEKRKIAENERKIQEKVTECRKLMDHPKTVTIESMDKCLADASTINPMHEAIVGLKAEVDRLLTERKINDEKRAGFLADSRKLIAIYNKAVAVDKLGRIHETIDSYEKVIKAKHVDPGKLKDKSRKRIDEILNKIATEQAAIEREAEQYQKEGKWKLAALALRRALVLDPDNEVVKGHLKYVIGELSKTLQSDYHDSIFLESRGEVDKTREGGGGKKDNAREIWKSIVERSLPTENYYEKARIKLKKYGDL